jgi:hypothetical protein
MARKRGGGPPQATSQQVPVAPAEPAARPGYVVPAETAAKFHSPGAEPLIIKLRRNAKCGSMDLLKGTRIAEVRLEPGVGLNYLVDAIRGGVASEVDLTTS